MERHNAISIYYTQFNRNNAFKMMIMIDFNYIKQTVFQSAFILCFDLEWMHSMIFQNLVED